MCTKKTMNLLRLNTVAIYQLQKIDVQIFQMLLCRLLEGCIFLATTKIVKEVMKGSGDIRLPICFKIKGLLVKRKDQMTLYTVDVNLASVSSAALMFRYQDFHAYGSASVTMAHLCSRVTKLTLD